MAGCLNFLLIPQYGAFGAAYATVASFLILFIIKYQYAKTCYFINYNWVNIGLVATPLLFIILFFHININSDIYITLFIKLIISGVICLIFIKIIIQNIKTVKA